MKALLLLALLAQDSHTIPKSHKTAYLKAVGDYDKALGLCEKDPGQAIELMTNILGNSKIDKHECRIRIERATADYTDWKDFFPYQLRGRARVKLAETDAENAESLLQEAIKDFQESVKRNVKSSEPYLNDARNRLEKLRQQKKNPSTPVNPEPAFEAEWLKLIGERKYKSAKQFVESQGGFLDDAKRKGYLQKTEDACAERVTELLNTFRARLELNAAPAELRKMKPNELEAIFALPDDAELVGSYPALQWSRKQREVLLRLRKLEKKEEVLAIIDELLAQMVGSEPLGSREDSRWFRVAATIAFKYIEDLGKALVSASQTATPEARSELKKEAEGLGARWESAKSKLSKEFLAKNSWMDEHSNALSDLIRKFPIDLAELDAVNLDSCLASASPEKALSEMEASLRKIWDEKGSSLSRQSSQKLLTLLIASSAMRRLLEGDSVEKVAEELRLFGKELSRFGGPLDPKRWGPKVEKVFTALR